MSTLSDKQFREQAESGQLEVNGHKLLLRIALMYLLDHEYVLSNTVKKLHSRGWSFGKGSLEFNRTLDIFYTGQITVSLRRSTDSWVDEDTEELYKDNFEAFYAEYQGLLHEDVWKKHYTPAYLAQASTARFWRLPNLWDRTDTSEALRAVRRGKGTGQFTKLPRWAYLVTRTHWRQPTLSKATITQIAKFTLQTAIPRQQMYSNGPDIQPYSETQVHFWLDQMGMYRTTVRLYEDLWDLDCLFGSLVAQGNYDIHRWGAYYSRERWESMEARRQVLEPDLDGGNEIRRRMLPDGRLMGDVSETGWEEELGSEEEIMFLAAVAAREVGILASERMEAVTPKATTTAGNDLKYAVRSYILLEVLRAAFETDRARSLDDLKQRVVDAGRLDSSTVGPWMDKVLEIMEPYAAKRTSPTDLAGWSRLLQMVLEENGQLFGRWKQMGGQNPFQLGPRRDLIHTA